MWLSYFQSLSWHSWLVLCCLSLEKPVFFPLVILSRPVFGSLAQSYRLTSLTLIKLQLFIDQGVGRTEAGLSYSLLNSMGGSWNLSTVKGLWIWNDWKLIQDHRVRVDCFWHGMPTACGATSVQPCLCQHSVYDGWSDKVNQCRDSYLHIFG